MRAAISGEHTLVQRVWRILSLALLLAANDWARAQTSSQPASSNAVTLNGLRLAPALAPHARVPENQNPAFLLGDAIAADGDGVVTLRGDAQVRRIDAVVKGELVTYDRNTGDVRVRGNGLMMRDANIVTGPALHYNLHAGTGSVAEPQFWMASGGSGSAREAQILSQRHMRLLDAIYTSCPCPDPAWFIESSRVDMDFDANEGVARNAVLYFKGVPILATPYFQFPLRPERKSGLLTPVYGMSTRSGIEFALPYYLNLAPNYDATLTPRYLHKRGLQLGGEFRYLGRNWRGQIDGTYLPKDKGEQIKRWLLNVDHQHHLGGGFSADLNVQRASDDDYFRDFATLGLGDSTATHLSSTANLRWSDYRYFSMGLTTQTYQTLQDRDLSGPIQSPYDKLPELHLRAARYDWKGFDVVSENTFTHFYLSRYHGTIYPNWDPTLRNRRLAFDGTRFSSYTSIAYPIVRAGWYATPKAALHASQYDTRWHASELPVYTGRARGQSRVLPLLSLDAGMAFERNTTLFGQASIQTLEPRLYYLYVPYRDQRNLPVYDTALASFNFAQVFDENIYSGGWDRIANANQLTQGLTSRWLDADTGFERMSLSAAQRFYFSKQRVSLAPDPRTARRSDYLVGVNAALTNTFQLHVNTQFRPESRDRSRMTAGVRWEPKRLTSATLSYRYEADRNMESVMLAGQWPITSKIYALGRFDYSLQERRNTQSIMGLEYKGDCCWVARAVAQRYAVSARDVNTAIFFQLELSGLGSLGADPMQLLRKRVTGYQPITHTIRDATPFERYE